MSPPVQRRLRREYLKRSSALCWCRREFLPCIEDSVCSGSLRASVLLAVYGSHMQGRDMYGQRSWGPFFSRSFFPWFPSCSGHLQILIVWEPETNLCRQVESLLTTQRAGHGHIPLGHIGDPCGNVSLAPLALDDEQLPAMV